MDLMGTVLSGISQTEKDKYHMISTHVESQKQKHQQTKQDQTHRYREHFDGCQMVEELGRDG